MLFYLISITIKIISVYKTEQVISTLKELAFPSNETKKSFTFKISFLKYLF